VNDAEVLHEVVADAAHPPCLLLNPRSFRLSLPGLAEQVQELAWRHGARLIAVDTPASIAAALHDFIARSPRWVGVLGGDGTVQETVTLLGDVAPDRRPALLILGGGRTNLIAADIGQRGALLQRLQRALQAPVGVLPTTTRHSILVSQGADLHELGFFLAGAGVDDIIRDCHRYRERGGGALRQGHLSTAWRVLQLAWLKLRGRLQFPTHTLAIDAGPLGQLQGAMRVLLVSSLEHRSGVLEPYAARGAGAVRVTAIATQARRFWLRAPGIIAGWFPAATTPLDGYLSGRSERVTIRGLENFTLDGQEFCCDRALLLEISAGPAFELLCP